MIACQHAETTGIDGQCLVNSKFCGEIRHRPITQVRLVLRDPCVVTFGRELGIELPDLSVVVRQVLRVIRRRIQEIRSDAMQEEDRILIGRFPQLRIELAEQVSGRRVPTPPEVVREITQPLDPGGQAEQRFRHRYETTPLPEWSGSALGTWKLESSTFVSSCMFQRPRCSILAGGESGPDASLNKLLE